MNFSDIVTITSMPGLWEVTKKRADGLIVSSLADGKTTFVSQRQAMFTPLDNITIYTDDEPVELRVVLLTMKDQLATNPLPNIKADGATLRGYFEKILPTYDQERVYTSDIVKLIKWFDMLNSKDLIKAEETIAEAPIKAEVDAPVEEKKVAKKAKKADTPVEEAEIVEVAKEEKPKKKTTKKAE